MTEYFDVLDENGNKTGKIKARELVHRDGDWHRSVHVWIVDPDNRVLLQKRSPTKDSHPNKWDISSAGHLGAGDDSVSAAVREVYEELGLKVAPDDLRFLATVKTDSRHRADFINREFSDVYLTLLSLAPEDFVLQKEEVSAIKWVTGDELRGMIAARDPDLLIHERDFELLFAELGHLGRDAQAMRYV